MVSMSVYFGPDLAGKWVAIAVDRSTRGEQAFHAKNRRG